MRYRTLGFGCMLFFLWSVACAMDTQQTAIPKTVVNEETGAVLSLRGVAKGYQDATHLYNAALYTQYPATTPDAALRLGGPKRMWIVFLQHVDVGKLEWRNAIALNNSPEQFEEEQLKINQFEKMLQRAMKPGDTITIEYVPNLGTKVMVNSAFKGIIKGNKFFNLVLKSWLGRFPPSEKFRYDLFNLS